MQDGQSIRHCRWLTLVDAGVESPFKQSPVTGEVAPDVFPTKYPMSRPTSNMIQGSQRERYNREGGGAVMRFTSGPKEPAQSSGSSRAKVHPATVLGKSSLVTRGGKGQGVQRNLHHSSPAGDVEKPPVIG